MSQIIKTVFWDLDGTLIDSELVHEESAFFATAELGFRSLIESVPAGLENATVFELMTGLSTSSENQSQLHRWNELAIEYALTRIKSEQGIIQSLELFNYFAGIGLPQAVVSNSSERIVRHSLKELGILEQCSQIFSRDSVQFGKPHPQLYLNALEFHQRIASECLAFEDSNAGITAAKSCGINVIGIGTNTLQYVPNFVCDLTRTSWLEQIQEQFFFD